MEEILLKAENISYSYEQGETVLKGLDLSVKKGERIAVLGSNGAGKSTFFLCLNGVLKPEGGRILYRGKEIGKRELNELRKNVGFVFQDPDSQLIASTVFSEVSFGPVNLRLSREEVKRRVEMALTAMSLTEMRDRPPHYLSGGEKKRVSIADILAMESEVVLFDEPTASLDPANVNILECVLERMSKMGKTLLISTHDVDFAWRWAGRAVVFSEGEVIADGPIESVFGDSETVERAGLRLPVMLEVYRTLVKHGVLKEKGGCPKSSRELDELFPL